MAENRQRTVSVDLFKESGKWYTSESWRLPEGGLLITDMANSPDFHRIGNGKVLICAESHDRAPEDENWGFPQLL